LHAVSRENAIQLDWLRTLAATKAILERAGAKVPVDGRNGFYRDTCVAAGRQYTYYISDRATIGFAPAPVSLAAGLPTGWSSGALGKPIVSGDVQFDGRMITIVAAGAGFLQPRDEGHFVTLPNSASRIEVQVVPPIASQFVEFGVMCRVGDAASTECAALLVMPRSSERGRRDWQIRLMVRDSAGAVSTLSASLVPSSVTTYGRLMKPIWFRIESRGRLLNFAYSVDGSMWSQAGETPRIETSRIGLIAASGIVEVATCVRFEILTA